MKYTVRNQVHCMKILWSRLSINNVYSLIIVYVTITHFGDRDTCHMAGLLLIQIFYDLFYFLSKAVH